MVSCSDAGGNELRLAASCKPQARSAAKQPVGDTRMDAVLAGGWTSRGRTAGACIEYTSLPRARARSSKYRYASIHQSMRYRHDLTFPCCLILPHGAGHEWWLVMRATVLQCVVHYGVHESSHAWEARSVSALLRASVACPIMQLLDCCSLVQRHPSIHDT
jgi:hypothetical protein